MEKSLQSRLFRSALSARENRLVFQGTPEAPKNEHAQEMKSLIDAIKDPNVDMKDVNERLRKLQEKFKTLQDISPELQTGILDFTQGLFERSQEIKAQKGLKNAQNLTGSDNADWKKITEGIKPEAGKVDADAVELAKKKIKDARQGIIDLAVDSDRPKNAVAQAEAFNKVITDIQALDPKNTIQFVEGVGGDQDDEVLKTAKGLEATVYAAGGDLMTAMGEYEKVPAAGKEVARAKLDETDKAQREKVWEAMATDLAGAKGVPYVNAEQIAATYLGLIKKIKKDTQDIKNKVEPGLAKPAEAKGGAGTPAPVEAPKENPETVIGELGIGAQVAALESAVNTPGGDIAGTLTQLNKNENVKKDPLRVATALTTKFAEKGVKFTVENKKIVQDTSAPVAPAAGTEAKPSAKEKAEDMQLLEKIIKMIIDFLRGENITRLEERAEKGDINALRGLRNIKKKEITEIKKNKELSKTEKDEQIADLTKEIAELDQKIPKVEQRNNEFAKKAAEQTVGTPVAVNQEGGKGKGGAPFFQSAPNVPAPQASAQMQNLFNGVQSQVPGGVTRKNVNGTERIYVNMNGYLEVNVSDTPFPGMNPNIPFGVTPSQDLREIDDRIGRHNAALQQDGGNTPPPPAGPRARNRGRQERIKAMQGRVDNLNEGSRPAPSATNPDDIPPPPLPPLDGSPSSGAERGLPAATEVHTSVSLREISLFNAESFTVTLNPPVNGAATFDFSPTKNVRFDNAAMDVVRMGDSWVVHLKNGYEGTATLDGASGNIHASLTVQRQ